MRIQSLEGNFSSLITCQSDRESNRKLMGLTDAAAGWKNTAGVSLQVKQDGFTFL